MGTKKSADRLIRFLDPGYPRRVELRDEFRQAGVDVIKGQLRTFARISKEPIVIDIDSNGGSLVAGLRLRQCILSVGQKAPVYAVVTGSCMSSAFLVLQSCSLRTALPDSLFGIHNNYTRFRVDADMKKRDIERMVPNLIKEAVSNRRARARLIGHLRSRLAHMSRDDILILMRQARIIRADEALHLGFIDEIVR